MIRAYEEYFLWNSTFIFELLYLDRLETEDREGVNVGQVEVGIGPLTSREVKRYMSLEFYTLDHTKKKKYSRVN